MPTKSQTGQRKRVPDPVAPPLEVPKLILADSGSAQAGNGESKTDDTAYRAATDKSGGVTRQGRSQGASAHQGNDSKQDCATDPSTPEAGDGCAGGPVTGPHHGVKPSFLAVDFFCGAGGTTRGLLDADGYAIAGIDKDPSCGRTYTENNTNTTLDHAAPRFLCHDVFPKSKSCPEGEQSRLMAALGGLIAHYRDLAPSVPLMFAVCAPCQPFTRLSQVARLTRQRQAARKRDQGLLREAVKFVRAFMPELVFAENVRGIDTPRHGGVWKTFQSGLEGLGYAIGSRTVCTSRFGVPQHRKRTILLAVRRDCVSGFLGEALEIPDADPNVGPVSVREAIDHLPPIKAGRAHPTIPNHRARALSDLNRRRLRVAKPGESNACLERTRFGDLSLCCHRAVNRRQRTRCFTDVYTRMHPDRPSPTITTNCHSISTGRFGHYDTRQHRGISLREAATLQSFPENYVFHPPDKITPVARMIGNAVPPRLAEFFARHLVGLSSRRACHGRPADSRQCGHGRPHHG